MCFFCMLYADHRDLHVLTHSLPTRRSSDLGVTSRGTFATADANLAAAFGPVTGLTTTLTFEDLINLRTAPSQVATVAEINPGVPVTGGTIEYRLLGDNRIRIEGGRWPFAGGELVLHPATLDFNAVEPRHLSFDLIGEIGRAHV